MVLVEDLTEGESSCRTIIGVAARERGPSPNMLSMNRAAGISADSDESHACRDSCAEARDSASIILLPMDRKRTSSASCVSPRWLRDPRIVCV